MNRLEEYQELLKELETPIPELETIYERADKRYRRRNRYIRSFVSGVSVFLLFVVLVNVSAPVAQACSRIPVLKELAAAVTFSPSLTDAVEHEYAQPMGLVERDGDVEATIAYLIVDQKQVNIFFSLDSEVYTRMNAHPRVFDADGSSPTPCSYSMNAWDVENGELNSITIDFVDADVPDSLLLKLDIMDYSQPVSEEIIPDEFQEDKDAIDAPGPEEDIYAGYFEESEGPEEEDYIAHFEFLLEFDPEYTEQGQIYEINETVELDGQQIIIESVGIYPTHMRVEIADMPENTAWLKKLEFYVETENRQRFEPVGSGITAVGSTDDDTRSMVSFRADSSFFYDAKKLKLVITGAEWLRKDMEKVYINLETKETGQLPEDVTLVSATKHAGGWILSMQAKEREEHHTHQILYPTFYDMEGNEYSINSWSSGWDTEEGYFIEEVPLKDFHETEVYVMPSYSHLWTADEPVEVIVK